MKKLALCLLLSLAGCDEWDWDYREPIDPAIDVDGVKERRICDMKEGERVYTLPWAFDGETIREDYPIGSRKYRTLDFAIKKERGQILHNGMVLPIGTNFKCREDDK